jgi:hypothetical protein
MGRGDVRAQVKNKLNRQREKDERLAPQELTPDEQGTEK